MHRPLSALDVGPKVSSALRVLPHRTLQSPQKTIQSRAQSLRQCTEIPAVGECQNHSWEVGQNIGFISNEM